VPKASSNPYARFREQSLTLNDYLAIDRTVLSNERTFLAYGRTALAQIIIGGSAMKLFESVTIAIIGWLFLLGGVVTLFIGWYRYRHTSQLLRVALESQTGEEGHPLQEKLEQKIEESKEAKATGG
jgi:putative membrane protein